MKELGTRDAEDPNEDDEGGLEDESFGLRQERRENREVRPADLMQADAIVG